MNMLAIIISIIVVIVILALVYFHTSSSTVAHTIIWEGSDSSDPNIPIFEGSYLPPVSSDAVDNVLVGREDGIFLSTTAHKQAVKINSAVATGLAFDGQDFMMMQADGTAWHIDLDGTKTQLNPGTGYTALYDTEDGYFITVNGVSSVTGDSGSTTKANGDYGLIQLKIS